MAGTGVILPAYNVAGPLPAVIAAVGDCDPGLRILVVDDGSADATATVAAAAGAMVIRHPQNRGKGAALATGFAWAVAEGLDWVYTMDADGQHVPSEMVAFRREADRGGFDVVVGDRMQRTGSMPWLRKATNAFTSAVISRLAGTRIPDSQNGYRLLRVALLDGLELRTERYDTESEILVRLARRGARIGSVAVTTIYGDEKSSINPVVDTIRFFRLVAVLLTSHEPRTGGHHA